MGQVSNFDPFVVPSKMLQYYSILNILQFYGRLLQIWPVLNILVFLYALQHSYIS